MIATLPMLAAVGLGWALLWPESPCSDPFCAKQRFSIFIEVDAFKQVKPVPFELDGQDGDVSIRSVFATGGIDVNAVLDQSDLPYDESVGRLNDADLYQLASVWRNRPAPAGADARLYALIAPRLVSNTGETLFGVMFDTRDREAFAVAPQETIDRFKPEMAPSIPGLQMRTFMHELLHALNRTHLDAAQFHGGHLTIEAPTKCLVDGHQKPWSLDGSPLMALSPDTIRFFQTAAVEEVLPGKANKPYKPRRSSADECAELRATHVAEPAYTRWTLAMRRLKSVPGFLLGAADAAEQEEKSAEKDAVRFELQSLPVPYPLGYPVAIRLMAANDATKPLPLRGRLNPSFGIVQIDVKAIGADDWKTLRPLVWFEPADDSRAVLEPGQSTEQTVAVYFGEDGWTFPEPGVYEIRARLKLGDDHEEVVTQAARIGIAAPGSKRDTAALALLTGEDSRLDPELGRLSMFGGRIGERVELTPIERLVNDFPDTALGAASRLTLASRRLRRPLDPVTGTRPAPDRAGANRLLNDSCTDSGVSALRDELVASVKSTNAPGEAEDTRHLAWDGYTKQGTARFKTYSDPALTPVGPTIHFCVNERRMRNNAWYGTERLSRTVRAMKPLRVVVIGHTDDEGGCGYNDELGLARAESVRNVLVKAGIRPSIIQTVALGKRRPMDFSSTADARMLNRRVEILVETAGEKGEGGKTLVHAVPFCPDWGTPPFR